MVWIEGILDAWHNHLTPRQEQTYRQQPRDRRTLNEDDLASFGVAMDRRVPVLEVADVQNTLRTMNPYRWRRLQSDMNWMRKKLDKMGLNPEDAGLYL